jgi:hypothetical protein
MEASAAEDIDGADTASVMAFDAVEVASEEEEDSGSSETWS